MTTFNNVLCVLEIGNACKFALERAVTLAENYQADLTVVDVVERAAPGAELPQGDAASADLRDAMMEFHARELNSLVEPYSERIQIQTKVLVGIPFLEIIREVLRNGHDLVMKIPEKLDWLDRLFGSNDMNLLRECPCPVWLTKPQESRSHRHILAAVDVGDAGLPAELESRRVLNQQVLDMASSTAQSELAKLHIVHVWEPFGEIIMRGEYMRKTEAEIVAYMDQLRQRRAASLEALVGDVIKGLGQDVLDYLKPQTHLVKGWPRKEIPALAKRIEADLVVMGTVARTGIPGFIMGNTAEMILNQIDCSVLAIKPPNFATPITLEG